MKIKQIAVLGLGVFGSTLATTLEENGIEVLAVDKDIKCVERIADDVTRAIVGDVTDKDQLLELGIEDFDVVVVSMSKHFEDSVITSLTLKELGIKKVIATTTTKRKKNILEKIGVDEVINIQKEMAKKLAKNLLRKNIIDLISLEDGYSIGEIAVPTIWVGRSLKDINVRQKYNLNIIGITRDCKMNMSFDANYVVNDDDHVIVAGKTEDIERWDRNTK